jgi:hypothetical protein
MRAGQSQLTECRAVGTQLVGYEQFLREPLFLEQLAHQPQRCVFVPPALNQHIEDLASWSTARHRWNSANSDGSA